MHARGSAKRSKASGSRPTRSTRSKPSLSMTDRAINTFASLAHFCSITACKEPSSLPDRNYGTSASLNRGWQAAAGDWIQFLDGDDLLAPNKLDVQMRQLSQLPDVICSSWQRFRPYGDSWQAFGPATNPDLVEPVLLKLVSAASRPTGAGAHSQEIGGGRCRILRRGCLSRRRASDAQTLGDGWQVR